MNSSGSDFAPNKFTSTENAQFGNLLTQLRSFEAEVCQTFRQIGAKFSDVEKIRKDYVHRNEMEMKIDSVKEIIELLKGSVKDSNLGIESDLDLAHSKILDMETEFNRIKIQMETYKNFHEIEAKCEAFRRELSRVSRKLDSMELTVDIVEQQAHELEERVGHLEENASESDFIWNGHHDVFGANSDDENEPIINRQGIYENNEGQNSGNDGNENNGTEINENMGNKRKPEKYAMPKVDGERELVLVEPKDCEVMVADPFLLVGGQMTQFDGNPTVSFTRWIEKFQDVISLFPQELTEAQKLNRLRMSLMGPARVEFDMMQPAATTLALAINHLKKKFENNHTKSIARQALSICRQAPGEKVFEFANRLNEAVRTALAGEDENIIRKRLLEEFMDRLIPELQYEVKGRSPTQYSQAYELAQHYKLLQGYKHSAANSAVAQLAEKVEALVVNPGNNYNIGNQRGNRGNPKTCYYCRKLGHIARDCRQKKRDEEFGNRGNNQSGNYYGNNYNNNRPSRRDWGRNYQHNETRYVNRENYYGGNNQQRGNYRGNSGGRQHSSERRGGTQGAYSPAPRAHSPAPRVHFNDRSAGNVRLASPVFFLAIVALSLINMVSAGGGGPMICLSETPTTLWKLPEDPICPSWRAVEIPVPTNLTIFRANTVQYKTNAYACKCVRTKIHRRSTIFGSALEEIETENLPVPTSTCVRMKGLGHSPAGELTQNGTLAATNNSLEVGWRFWPINVVWKTNIVDNCFVYDTVVFTRHGIEGISTPVGECPGCQYQSGACKCSKNSLIWKPDKDQLCSYIKVATWEGEFASNIWISNTNDFALSFTNVTSKNDCDGTKIVADQGFAIGENEYKEMIKMKNSVQNRAKRNLDELKNMAANVGIVYSSQLSAQLTALSTRVAQTTQQLFVESIQKICTSLQAMSDQMFTLANANPTLLARFFLSNAYIAAKLATEKTLEIRPCLPINKYEMHFNYRKGHCFDKLPVTFTLFGNIKHGFLDTNTQIIHAEAKEITCENSRFLYVPEGEKVTQYDQISGEIKEIPKEGMHQLGRYGKLDFPEITPTIFRNKIMANITELYSAEHFAETLEAAEITHEIFRLSRPNSPWSTQPNKKAEEMASSIVSNGLFSFLRGGLPSPNQIWVFVCCCYVSASAASTFLLPPFLAELGKYLSIGGSIVKIYKKGKKRRAERKNQQEQRAIEEGTIEGTNSVPLTERWPTPPAKRLKLMPKATEAIDPKPSSSNALVISTRQNNNNIFAKNANSEMLMAYTVNCDDNLRVKGNINGLPITFLLDTGANVSLGGPNTVAKYGLGEIFLAEIAGVFGIGEQWVPCIGQCRENVTIAGCTVQTKISIMETDICKEKEYDIILGRGSLKQLKFPPPSNLKEVKRFLGLTSFFRKFIPNFANIANVENLSILGENLCC